MNKIHSTQLFAILMLSAAWSVLCLPEIGSSTMLISCAVMLAVLLILSVPMLLLTAEGFSLSQAAARKKSPTSPPVRDLPGTRITRVPWDRQSRRILISP